MKLEDKQAVLDKVADILEAELDGISYVLILADTTSSSDGTDFATCTNVDEAGVAYIVSCVGKDMALALANKGTSQ